MTNTHHLRRANELKRLGMDGTKISFVKKIIWHSTLVYNQYHTVWYTNTLYNGIIQIHSTLTAVLSH